MYITKKLIATALMAGAVISAGAVIAKRGVRTVTQPDGTTLRIQKTGDEHRHLTLTEDGIVLYERDGEFTYAVPGETGQPVSTGVKARNAEVRTVADRAVVVTLDDFVERAATLSATAVPLTRKVAQSGMGLCDKTYPVRGDVRSLVILVEYADVKFTLDNPGQYFTDMLTKPGFDEYGGTGSALDYFTENSAGLFTPQFDVYGPIKLKHERKYYGGNSPWTGEDMRPEEMIIEACEQLDSIVDFNLYDTNGDRLIDNIFVFYAGQGEASYGPAESVWPHSWDVRGTGTTYKFDGVTLATYGCTNEWELNRPDGVGTFVHEFSHVMGLPDLYDTNGILTCTPGAWSVLDYGPYNNDGCTPPNYGAYERNALGWIEPLMLDREMDVTLPEISQNVFGLMTTDKETEFYLFENRQQIGWDKYLPGHGMLIWHVDYSSPRVFANNEVNNSRNHQYVDIVEANGAANSNSLYSQSRYTFPGPLNKTSISGTTTPALKSWAGKPLDLSVTDIAENAGLITFRVKAEDSGVDDVAIDEAGEGEAIYYNLQGIRVENPKSGDFLIRVCGNKTSKVSIK